MKIKFIGYRAIESIENCHRFKEGHEKVLLDYGITNITTNTFEWMKDPNVYVVMAISTDNDEVVGGIRIHISGENTSLPVESAVGHMDPNIYNIVKHFRQHGGVAELCALWNAKKVAGKGVSTLLTRASIAATIQLNFQTLMGICADYTMDMFNRVGFRVNPELGNSGEFKYPNENYIARVLGIMNAITLETAHPYDKERMISLRENLIQLCNENERKGQIEADYNLIFSK
jgi:hypothetical protein